MLHLKTSQSVSPFTLNFEWEDCLASKIIKQQIAIQSTLAQNRGYFISTYEVVHRLDFIKNELANYYFSLDIAVVEVQKWANLINQTLDNRLVKQTIINKHIVEENPRYKIEFAEIKYEFKSGLEFTLYRFDAISKSDLFVIDKNDLFPRFYHQETYRDIEKDNWIQVRNKELNV